MCLLFVYSVYSVELVLLDFQSWLAAMKKPDGIR